MSAGTELRATEFEMSSWSAQKTKWTTRYMTITVLSTDQPLTWFSALNGRTLLFNLRIIVMSLGFVTWSCYRSSK